MQHTTFHAFCIAAPRSGEGKTTASIALMRALARRGLRVQGFKCGPDYIDPTFHAQATGLPACNLDTWMMGRDGVRALWDSRAHDADAAVCEGVMGLFGQPRSRRSGGWHGRLRPRPRPSGRTRVNGRGWRVPWPRSLPGSSFMPCAWASASSEPLPTMWEAPPCGHTAPGTERANLPPLLGALPRREEWRLPRTPALASPGRGRDHRRMGLDALAEMAEQHLDIDRLLALTTSKRPEAPAPLPSENVRPRRMGIAKDKAFCFYYEENERVLRSQGWEPVPFSPLADTALPIGIEALYLGGGYPEVFARELSRNAAMRENIRDFAARGGEIYAECGGYMYLCTTLEASEEAGARGTTAASGPCAALSMPRRAWAGASVPWVPEASMPPARPSACGTKPSEDTNFTGPTSSCTATIRPRTKSAPAQASKAGVAFGNVRAGYVHLYWGNEGHAEEGQAPKAGKLRKDFPPLGPPPPVRSSS
ncbi:MAG: hypothetical protein ACLR0N_10610 [Bilophila wadsworthia]